MSSLNIDKMIADQDLSHLYEFIELLEAAESEVEKAPSGAFASVIERATAKYGLDRMLIAARFGVDKATVSRWARGKNAPPPAARAKVVAWMRDHMKRDVSALEAEIT